MGEPTRIMLIDDNSMAEVAFGGGRRRRRLNKVPSLNRLNCFRNKDVHGRPSRMWKIEGLLIADKSTEDVVMNGVRKIRRRLNRLI